MTDAADNTDPKNVAESINALRGFQDKQKNKFAPFLSRGWSFNGQDGVHRGLSSAIVDVREKNGQLHVSFIAIGRRNIIGNAVLQTAEEVLKYVDEVDQHLSA